MNLEKERRHETPIKDMIQMVIVVGVITTYCYLVATKTASVEGFVVLATYVIKKFLDDLEDNRPYPPEQ